MALTFLVLLLYSAVTLTPTCSEESVLPELRTNASNFKEETEFNITIFPADGTWALEGNASSFQVTVFPPVPEGFDLSILLGDRDVAKLVMISLVAKNTSQTRIDISPLRNDSSGFNLNHVENSSYQLQGSTFDIVIRGKRLGRCPVQLFIQNKSSPDRKNRRESGESVVDYEIIVLRKRSGLVGIFTNVIVGLLILINFGFGCELDLEVVWGIIKKPIPPMIGFFCQFLAMPLIGLAVSQGLQMDKTFGFGLVALACSPGGGASNSWTLLLGGDVNLSLTMTFLSIIMAMVMMPLWLFIVGRIYLSSGIQIPYLVLLRTLATFAVPCILGVAFHKLRPTWGKKVAKLLKPLTLIFLLWILTMGTYVNLYMWKLMGSIPNIIPAGILLPWVGYLIGFTIATACRQSRRRAITIAIETGIQNIGIPIVMLQGHFPQPEGDLAATMANAVGLFTPVVLYVALIVRTVKQKCFEKQDPEKLPTEDEMDAVALPNTKQDRANDMNSVKNQQGLLLSEDRNRFLKEG